MTKTETPECYFCQGPATAIKRDVTLEQQEDARGNILDDIEVIELLPICGPCNYGNYDDTEAYPALLPLP